ncbi:uncharacterized protein TM35_000172730 [Trypanosoma theileri]|uniref:Oxidoreductase n=1 Tax=Trypanosoma theileri TaxID=67003 RepID=A0A1X0NUW5_9TRYP|nr:uncharacterized protein TM35_000172730 [Trypanosoma theileri]ORC88401.1 hypothetical protein TM35_000172730 [Trypanosoma theileri]
MLLELVLILLAIGIYWVWVVRPTSTNIYRPYKVVRGPLHDVHADYIVVGAGPGGIAAAECLLQEDKVKSVYILERGVDPSSNGPFSSFIGLFQMHNLISYSIDLVGSHFDSKWYVYRPLDSNIDSNTSNTDSKSYDMPHLVPYPRGCGVGGTSILDWAIYQKPLLVKTGLNHQKCLDVPHTFTVGRSPLSWGFTESAAKVLKKKHLSTLEEPQARDSVFPGLLRLDKDGRRLPLSHFMFRKVSQKLTLVESCEVIGVSLNDEGIVTSVRCKTLDRQEFSITVRKGVIFSAGVVGSARLLRQVFPKLPNDFMVRDALAVPLLFQALPGLSDDRKNLRSLQAYLAWWIGRRGPFLNSVCDTLAAVSIPSLGSTVEVVIFLVPLGGKDRVLYQRLGLDNILGSFSEGFMMLLVLRGVDGCVFKLHTEKMVDNSNLHQSGEPVISSSLSFLSEMVVEKVVTAFMEGIRVCREIVAERPLASLSTRQESIDATLLDDPKRAIQYVKLWHTPANKLTEHQRVGAPSLLNWAREYSRSNEYMKAYIHRHATWLGFGSGSCVSSLADEESLRVLGTQNVFIGDCSAVTEKMWKASGYDVLRAGSVSTAMSMGVAAAKELLSI